MEGVEASMQAMGVTRVRERTGRATPGGQTNRPAGRQGKSEAS